jgi:hypothetical protein
VKANKLTRGSNLRWESTRMMLPEHREEIIKHRSELHIQSRPILDDQELQEISSAVYSSFIQRTPISLILYNEYENRTVTGIVLRVDSSLQQIRIEGEWVKQGDVIGYMPEV